MNTLQIITFILGVLAALSIAIFTIPSVVSVFKTQDTSGIKLISQILYTSGSLLFLMVAILTTVNGVLTNQPAFAAVSSVIGLYLANGIGTVNSVYVLVKKIYNVKMSKKNNISEIEWCKQQFNKKQLKKNK